MHFPDDWDHPIPFCRLGSGNFFWGFIGVLLTVQTWTCESTKPVRLHKRHIGPQFLSAKSSKLLSRVLKVACTYGRHIVQNQGRRMKAIQTASCQMFREDQQGSSVDCSPRLREIPVTTVDG